MNFRQVYVKNERILLLLVRCSVHISLPFTKLYVQSIEGYKNKAVIRCYYTLIIINIYQFAYYYRNNLVKMMYVHYLSKRRHLIYRYQENFHINSLIQQVLCIRHS